MIPLVDLQAQYQILKGRIHDGMEKVLNHGQFIMGPEIFELEEKLGAFTGSKYAITCANGTDALFIALMAYEVKPEQAIFTTDLTFIATAEAIDRTGARPFFTDIDPRTKNMDPRDLDRRIQQVKKEGKYEPKGIIAVNLFGLPVDYEAISAVAKKYNMFLIEDAAQSFGASYKGRKSGSLGDISTTSFFPGKPLGCYGDGGAMFTQNSGLAERMRSIRQHGCGKNKYESIYRGINSRLDTIQAAILLCKLEILDQETAKRNQIAQRYNDALSGLLETPVFLEGIQSAWAQYSFCSSKRGKLQTHLMQKEIANVIYYPVPMHQQPVFSGLGYREEDFPVTRQTVKNILSLPVHAYLSEESVDFIINEVKKALD